MALSNNPQDINTDTWYYEEPKGLTLIHWTTDKDGSRRAINIVIPWRMVSASLARKASNTAFRPTAPVAKRKRRSVTSRKSSTARGG